MTVRTLGRTTLLVHDYDKALAFYRDRLGFHVLHDEPTRDGGRYLHIGVAAQRDEPPVELWLMQATGDDEALVGRFANRRRRPVVRRSRTSPICMGTSC